MGDVAQEAAPLTRDEIEAIRELAERARAGQINDVTVEPTAGETRHAIVMGLLSDAKAWLKEPERPLIVTRLGRWSIRVSTSLKEASEEGERIIAALRAGRAALSYVPRMLAEIARLRLRAEKAETQLKAIDAINEDDWENGEAASWVYKIRNGLPLDGMKTQEQLEDEFCAP